MGQRRRRWKLGRWEGDRLGRISRVLEKVIWFKINVLTALPSNLTNILGFALPVYSTGQEEADEGACAWLPFIAGINIADVVDLLELGGGGAEVDG